MRQLKKRERERAAAYIGGKFGPEAAHGVLRHFTVIVIDQLINQTINQSNKLREVFPRKLHITEIPEGISIRLSLYDFRLPFIVKGGDPAALSSTATLLRLHPPH